MTRSEPKPRWENFGRQLRYCRNSTKPNKLTQKELAGMLGLDAAWISNYEGAKSHPDRDRLNRIIEIFEQKLVDREELNKLREAHVGVNHISTHITDDQTLKFISQALKNPRLDLLEERNAFIEDVERLVNIWQSLWIAQEKMEKEKLQRARSDFEMLNSQFTKIGGRLHTRILDGFGRLHRYKGDSFAALKYLRAAVAESDGGDLLKQADIYVEQGNIYRRQGNWQKAENVYQKSLDIYVDCKEQKKVADMNRKFAGLRIRQGRFDDGLKICNKSIDICRVYNYQQGYLKGLQMRAWGLAFQGYYGKAIKEELEAIKIAEDLKMRRRDLAKAQWYLGDYLLRAKRLEEAEEAYTKAENMLSEAFDEELEKERLIYPMVLHGKGNVYLELGLYKEASNYLRKSLRLNIDANDEYHQGLNLRQIGRLEMALLNFSNAKINFDNAYDIFTNKNGPVSIFQQSKILVDKALLFLHQNAYLEATKNAEEAIEVAENYDFKPTLARARVVLGSIKLDNENSKENLEEVLLLDLLAVETTLELYVSVTSEILEEIQAQLKNLAHKRRVDDALFLSQRIIKTWPQRIAPANLLVRKTLQEWFIEVERFYLRLHATKETSL